VGAILRITSATTRMSTVAHPDITPFTVASRTGPISRAPEPVLARMGIALALPCEPGETAALGLPPDTARLSITARSGLDLVNRRALASFTFRGFGDTPLLVAYARVFTVPQPAVCSGRWGNGNVVVVRIHDERDLTDAFELGAGAIHVMRDALGLVERVRDTIGMPRRRPWTRSRSPLPGALVAAAGGVAVLASYAPGERMLRVTGPDAAVRRWFALTSDEGSDLWPNHAGGEGGAG